ncbi:serine hydrolase domain-containing protein [Longimicrobium sp.]|uniref:serine hydrolase domain-containing protein n=1 Tax=Longimicrobium sp. TaxID=2029185 RepID=UPI002E332BB0|nr:serine hydrolase domain-containing protein [Longimicrobium sp.]HEX6039282.1 serine hydrolase domain-containing protein [Longimicrobium sp.]
MRFSRVLLVPLALLAAPAAAQTSLAARADSLFAEFDSTTTPGCAVALSQDGRTVLARAYGMANLEHGIPNTMETVFEAGSVSKQFTAAAVVLLARQGKLSLDDDARRYVPELPDYGTPITLRHLLTHTSGLRDWGSVVELAGWPRGTRIHTHAHALDVIRRQRSLNFATGTEYGYSNTGYNLLAIIVERVSGVSLAEFTRRELFAPLGMTHTTWRDDFTRVVPGRAEAYARRDGAWHLQMPFENVYGNGGLLTTIGDLLRWNQALDEGTIAGLDTLETWAVLANGRRLEYGLGISTADFNGVRLVGHSGATAGYRAFLARFPEAKASVALLCNAADAGPEELALRTAVFILADRFRAPAAQPEDPPSITLETAALAGRAGTYRDRRIGQTLDLEVVNDTLRTGAGTRLIPVREGAFRLASGAGEVEFVAGQPDVVRLLWADGDTAWYDRAAPADTSAATLAGYAGEYYSDEAEAAYTVAVMAGRLVLRRRPDTVLRLAPAYADAFTTPDEWMVRFERGPDGRVRALTLGVDRVRALRFDRVGG